MSEKPKAKDAQASLNEGAVKAYLEQNLGFFRAHPDLLARMDLPARPLAKGNVEDFQSHALTVLRQRLEDLDNVQEELMDVARANMAIQARIHAAALAALDAHSLAHLIHVVAADWVDMLDVDVVSLCLEEDRLREDGVTLLPKGVIDEVLGAAHAVVLHGGVKGDARIFGAASELVRAEALVGLKIPGRKAQGLLAFGARDADAFSPGQGTELLRFLGHVLERALNQWMTKA